MELAILACLISFNGALAMSEVALLTARAPRLAALAKQGDALAAAAAKLAREPTRFLSTIQIGITSIGLLSGIVGEAALAAPLAAWLQSLGLEQKASGIAATAIVVIAVTYVSIVAGELVPKRLGQHNAEGIARLVAWPMRWLALVSAPFVHLLSASTDAILRPLLRLLRIRPQDSGAQPLSPEEIRALVLEAGEFLPKKHRTIVLNLFDLDRITVEDVMTPRAQIEAVDLDAPEEDIVRHLSTSYHTRLPVYRGELGNVIGILHLRRALSLVREGELDKAALETLLADPYFVPAETPALTQLQYFQEAKQRLALVVDEYGELQGLLTLEDIIEEIIGEFTTAAPVKASGFAWDEDGSTLVEGASHLRELNRKLGLALPLDGPKTLNGLLIEHLQDIPEAGVSVKISGVPMEIVQTQDRVVKTVRLFKPLPEPVEEAAT
jgi:Mg2+/Co2+ transporter CorB